MSHKRNRLVQQILFYPILVFFNITSRLPLSLTRRSATMLATLAYYLVPRIKKVGMANLDIVYGETLTFEEKNKILRESVKNLALVALEFACVPSIKNNLDKMNISVKGFENVNPDAGSVLMSAHLGNWEWLLPVGVHIGLHPVIVVRQFDDRRMDAIVDVIRRKSGIKTVPKDAALGPLLRRLQEGWQAGLLADQNPREDAVPVTFFGQSTWATIGPALIAMRAQVPIHPVSMVRNADFGYTAEFFPALELQYSGDTLADLQINTQRCQDALEKIIRRNPEQWLWFHRRWKKRERLEQEWADRIARRKAKAASFPVDTRPEKESEN